MQALADGEFDALVYDAPILRYLAGEEFSGTVSVLPVVFERQDYAIGLTLDSPVRKAVNRALLEIISDDSWGDVLYEYLGTSR